MRPRKLHRWTSTLSCAAAALAAAASGGCGNLDNVTTVHDLRVLAVRADPAGFLVDLQNPGAGLSDADLQATLTALVVDPNGGSQTVTYYANGCPDIIVDAITSATNQGTKICPDPNAPSTLPPEFASFAPLLQTQVVVPQDQPASAMPVTSSDAAAGGIEYHPALPPFGFTAQQLALFFSTATTGDPIVDQTIAYNRDFGVDAALNITYLLGSEQAPAVKRILYWPNLSSDPTLAATIPSDVPQPEVPNHNPLIDHLELYRARDAITGDPVDKLNPTDTVSIGNKDKLYVLPVFTPDQVEVYPLRVRNDQVVPAVIETQSATELLVFDFFTTAGTFSPAFRQNAPPVFSPPGTAIHIDSELQLPSVEQLPANGAPTDVWVVVRDERGGASWSHTTVNITQ
jgi:hypothetical protein